MIIFITNTSEIPSYSALIFFSDILKKKRISWANDNGNEQKIFK